MRICGYVYSAVIALQYGFEGYMTHRGWQGRRSWRTMQHVSALFSIISFLGIRQSKEGVAAALIHQTAWYPRPYCVGQCLLATDPKLVVKILAICYVDTNGLLPWIYGQFTEITTCGQPARRTEIWDPGFKRVGGSAVADLPIDFDTLICIKYSDIPIGIYGFPM